MHDPAKNAIVLDHATPAPTVLDASAHKEARRFAAEFGIEEFYDVGNHGISHQVVLERALGLPGQILACADSHTCATGALNCAARGLGVMEILQIVCTGETWYRVPETVLVEFTGDSPPTSRARTSSWSWRRRWGVSRPSHPVLPPEPGAAFD